MRPGIDCIKARQEPEWKAEIFPLLVAILKMYVEAFNSRKSYSIVAPCRVINLAI